MDKEKRAVPRRKAKAGRDRVIGKKEMAIVLLEAIAGTGVVAWVFYDSVWGMALFPGVLFVNYKRVATNREASLKKKFDLEFKEMLLAISAALQSGYSIENAFRDAEENLGLLYGKNTMILRDLKEMNVKISMREPAEKAFLEFANKHPTEEVLGFSNVFSFARRLGGDYVKNLKRTVEKMEDKLELKQDMETAVAEKQMELKVMCAMPFLILAYIKVSSYEFISAMYHNALGIGVMSMCIVLYVLFIFLGRSIVKIEV